jgi:UDP-N-acetylglucosamine 2-epimerase (non-hydrolysing)/GDP/UDP-N,N'-diacetylbacillosamine 2-epimerase (hydrolysing)
MGSQDILVLTGTRAEYGLLKSSMEAIKEHPNLSLSVVATGMHLSPRHGNTIQEIREDGFTVDREVLMQVDGDSGTAMAKSLGIGIMGLTDAFGTLDPDIVLLLGDRDEALAGALAAAHMNIPVAHIHGGDSMHGAVIDDSIRHAITKFAHIHFPASQLSADRLRKMGEEEWRISIAGAPGLDDILAGGYTDPDVVFDEYDLDPDKPLLLVVQHPVTTQPEYAGEQMAATLDAVRSFDAQTVLIYPNSDAGSDQMISEIESRSSGPLFHTFRNLPRRKYLGVMAAADVMVGNSSSGIIEAPSFDLPVVDIGPRQQGRERTKYTISVSHTPEEIQEAVLKCMTDQQFCEQVFAAKNPYNYGGASDRITQRLADLTVGEQLIRKQLDLELANE